MTPAEPLIEPVRPATGFPEISAPSPWMLMRRRAKGHAGLIIGGAILLLAIVMAVFAPWLAPHDPFDQDLAKRLVEPVWGANGSWSIRSAPTGWVAIFSAA